MARANKRANLLCNGPFKGPRRAAITGQEDGPFAALTDGQVDCSRCARRERDGDHLAALAGNNKRPMPALDAEGFDAGAGGFGDPQPVQREQGMLERSAEPGRNEHGAQLVAVQGGGVRLVVQPRPPDVGDRGMAWSAHL